jgi:hypothetical protein
MSKIKEAIVDSPLGREAVDSTGSPIGVVRMDVNESYAGIGELLQNYINNADERAWDRIKSKIDFIHKNLDYALSPLEGETGFGDEIRKRLEKGQKLLFKPNTVNPINIDGQTHGPGLGGMACTEWPFIAALMRWFHDKLGISYYQMSIGEAATSVSGIASLLSLWVPEGERMTPEAVIEGRSGDFYGGWGFYFARRYLADTLKPGAADDPMQGYEESVSGTYIPPGHVTDRLMVYDLNRLSDDESKGREVRVPDGVNYRSIVLHKAVVGGDTDDPGDREAYPGCILINVPKMKVHMITLLTNVIKNLGIGLYPMQFSAEGGHRWDYSVPNAPIPGMKGGIPHEIWIPEIDEKTGYPKRDKSGGYVVKKTGGINATMIDIIKAVRSQDIFMLHVVDAIETINADHTGSLMSERIPEGMVFAGLDPVALDLLCARYMFSNVPLRDAMEVDLDDGTGGRFPQAVPIPTVEGNNIVTHWGYDCPLSRDRCLESAEERGLGERRYHVFGRDTVTDSPVISLKGHLGTIHDGAFNDLITEKLYFAINKMPWDLQKTSFSYLDAIDRLTGTSLKEEFLNAFSENGKGIATYDDYGKKGILGYMMYVGGKAVSELGMDHSKSLSGFFDARMRILKCSEAMWNPEGHDLFREYLYGAVCMTAYRVSQVEIEGEDPFLPGLTWGRGKWPSFQLAQYVFLGISLYGEQFPTKVDIMSLYGLAFRYADMTQNEMRYAGEIRSEPDPEALDRYFSDLASGRRKPLDFTFYIPVGYDSIAGSVVPNVEITDDAAKIFTASFNGGSEVWS